ncbi:MAG: ABC transporter permease, partial [Firmicutes bacterium]|nr:ABC transporter permease [Bacillota bacterium]
MSRYIIKRILMIIPVILGVSLLIYLVMEQASGDAILQMNPDASPEQIEMLRHQYGYDRSVFYRYFVYLKGLVQGNLGMSITAHRPVMEI